MKTWNKIIALISSYKNCDQRQKALIQWTVIGRLSYEH